MRYLVWAVRLLVFVVVLLFALKNTDRVTVSFFADSFVSEVPLIVVMLATFVIGAVFGLLLTIPGVMRRRKELAHARREIAQLKAERQANANHQDTVDPADLMLPISPL
ncbi:MAG: LapA family protein [Pigmentiphaga sp.]|nr:LapA family protein [Pigmentiphaga sp.]